MVEFRQKLNLQAVYSVTRHQTKKVLPFIIGFSALLAILGVLCLVFSVDDEDYFLGIYLIVIAVVMPLAFFVILKVAQRSQNKSMSLLSDDTENIFIFDNDKVTIIQRKGDEYESNTKANYSFLFKVEETKTQYFLYVSKMQLHVIDKCNITKGTIEELNSYLINNLVYKYKKSK